MLKEQSANYSEKPAQTPEQVKSLDEIVVGAEYFPHSMVYGHEDHRTVFKVLEKPHQDPEGNWMMKVNVKYLNMGQGSTENISLTTFGVVPNKDGTFNNNWLEKKSE